MKTRVILLLAVSAVVTLSFTVVSVSNPKKGNAESAIQTKAHEPIGGFVAEDKL
jgi:hypothetical protein